MSAAEDARVDSPQPGSKESLILEAACKLFVEQGFEVTSMDAIAAEAGVSKRTVYSHFQSKEMLFVEIMGTMCERFGVGAQETVDPADPPEKFLCSAGRFVLSKIMDPRTQSAMRTIAAESPAFPEMGLRFWDMGPGNMRNKISDYLAAQDAAGVLRVPDPRLAASMFQSMVCGPQFLPMLFTGDTEWPVEEIDRIVRFATRIFLAAHQPDPS